MPLRYCAARFARWIPTWRLLPVGGVAGLVTDGGEEVGIVQVAGASCLHEGTGVDCVSGLGGGGKRVRLSRKTPAHHVRKSFLKVLFSHPCVEEIEGSCFSGKGAC